MFAYVAIPFTCWVCALIATPRKARLGNEVEELVYTRLLGRQHRLVLVALIATAVMFFILMVTAVQPAALPANLIDRNPASLSSDREGAAPNCMATPISGVPTCYALQADGTWLVVQRQADGKSHVVATVATRPPQ
ncbi:MAG: hypothetical protein ACYDAR_04145 [Thermomicrobiales bacterium]